jgi:hypothetical protein
MFTITIDSEEFTAPPFPPCVCWAANLYKTDTHSSYSLRKWRCRQHVSPNCWQTNKFPHGANIQDQDHQQLITAKAQISKRLRLFENSGLGRIFRAGGRCITANTLYLQFTRSHSRRPHLTRTLYAFFATVTLFWPAGYWKIKKSVSEANVTDWMS